MTALSFVVGTLASLSLVYGAATYEAPTMALEYHAAPADAAQAYFTPEDLSEFSYQELLTFCAEQATPEAQRACEQSVAPYCETDGECVDTLRTVDAGNDDCETW